jgi:hypothetical protein
LTRNGPRVALVLGAEIKNSASHIFGRNFRLLRKCASLQAAPS